MTRLINNFAKELTEEITVSKTTHICGFCGLPLEREETTGEIDLMFPPDGYDVVIYSNGNIKWVKLDQEVK